MVIYNLAVRKEVTYVFIKKCRYVFLHLNFILFIDLQQMLNFIVKQTVQLRQAKKQRDVKNQVNINIEEIVHRVQLHSIKSNIQRVKITQEQFIQLCRMTKKQLLSQPGLLKIEAPIFVSTGTLGNYQALANIIDRCGHPKFMNYLFLGDYTGYYDQSLECLITIFAYKLFSPNNFFILRGCHQTIAMARSTGLYSHIVQYFGSAAPWFEVCQTFCALPYAALINDKALCVHGGISPFLQSLQQINQIPRPLDAPTRELACDLLWADPTNLYQGWTQNDRGLGVSFGSDVVHSFVKTHDLSIVCRGHQVPYQGFKFFADKRMVTICSLSKFCGNLNNSGAVMMIDDSNNALFKIISEKSQYTGYEHEQALTFVDLVKKRKEKQRLLEQQLLSQQSGVGRKEKSKTKRKNY